MIIDNVVLVNASPAHDATTASRELVRSKNFSSFGCCSKGPLLPVWMRERAAVVRKLLRLWVREEDGGLLWRGKLSNSNEIEGNPCGGRSSSYAVRVAEPIARINGSSNRALLVRASFALTQTLNACRSQCLKQTPCSAPRPPWSASSNSRLYLAPCAVSHITASIT